MPNFEPPSKHERMQALTDWMIVADEYYRVGTRHELRWLPEFTIGGVCSGARLDARDWSTVRSWLLAWIDAIDGLGDPPTAQAESKD